MKPVSIETQKTLKYLPVLNSLVFFIFFYNCFAAKLSWKTELKAQLYMLLISFPLQSLNTVLASALPAAELILQFLTSYLICTLWAHGLIRLQEDE